MYSQIILLILASLNFFSCSEKEPTTNKQVSEQIEEQSKLNETTGNAEYKIEEFVRGLEVPWSIVFTSDTRILVAERPGRIRAIENGKLIDQPLKTFSDVVSGGEEGLMGLTLDPDYSANKYVYVSYAYEDGDDMAVKVVRFTDDGSTLGGEKLIIDKLPARQYHAGCRLRFGPDKKLYITTGDAGERSSPRIRTACMERS